MQNTLYVQTTLLERSVYSEGDGLATAELSHIGPRVIFVFLLKPVGISLSVRVALGCTMCLAVAQAGEADLSVYALRVCMGPDGESASALLEYVLAIMPCFLLALGLLHRPF